MRQLAAILRVAGGLDRSHTQQVRGLTVTHHGGTTEIRVQSRAISRLDIWGARRRAELFEKVFDTQLKIEWDESVREAGESRRRPATTAIRTGSPQHDWSPEARAASHRAERHARHFAKRRRQIAHQVAGDDPHRADRRGRQIARQPVDVGTQAGRRRRAIDAGRPAP